MQKSNDLYTLSRVQEDPQGGIHTGKIYISRVLGSHRKAPEVVLPRNCSSVGDEATRCIHETLNTPLSRNGDPIPSLALHPRLINRELVVLIPVMLAPAYSEPCSMKVTGDAWFRGYALVHGGSLQRAKFPELLEGSAVLVEP